MADLTSILGPYASSPDASAAAQVFDTSRTRGEFIQGLNKLNLPDGVKADLYDKKAPTFIQQSAPPTDDTVPGMRGMPLPGMAPPKTDMAVFGPSVNPSRPQSNIDFRNATDWVSTKSDEVMNAWFGSKPMGDKSMARVSTGALSGMADAASGLTTGENLSLMGMMKFAHKIPVVGPLISIGAALKFGIPSFRQVMDSVKPIRQAWSNGEYEKVGYLAVQALVDGKIAYESFQSVKNTMAPSLQMPEGWNGGSAGPNPSGQKLLGPGTPPVAEPNAPPAAPDFTRASSGPAMYTGPTKAPPKAIEGNLPLGTNEVNPDTWTPSTPKQAGPIHPPFAGQFSGPSGDMASGPIRPPLSAPQQSVADGATQAAQVVQHLQQTRNADPAFTLTLLEKDPTTLAHLGAQAEYAISRVQQSADPAAQQLLVHLNGALDAIKAVKDFKESGQPLPDFMKPKLLGPGSQPIPTPGIQAGGDNGLSFQKPKPPVVNYDPDHPTPDMVVGKDIKLRGRENTDFSTDHAVALVPDIFNSFNYDTGSAQPRDMTDLNARNSMVQRMLTHPVSEKALELGIWHGDGIPGVNQQGIAEVGNHYSQALIVSRDAYRKMLDTSGTLKTNPTAKLYSGFLDLLPSHARQFGMSRSAVEDLITKAKDPTNDTKLPLLATIRRTNIQPGRDYQNFLAEANAPGVQGDTARELARNDQRFMGDAVGALTTDEDGNMTGLKEVASRFLNQMQPQTRGEWLQKNGEPNQALMGRVKNALGYYAYGSTELVEKAAEATDDNTKRITTGLMAAAPAVAKVRAYAEENGLSISDDLDESLDHIKRISSGRAMARKTSEFNTQALMEFKDNPVVKEITGALLNNRNSAKAVQLFMENYADGVAKESHDSSASQGPFMGQEMDFVPKTKLDLVKDAAKATEDQLSQEREATKAKKSAKDKAASSDAEPSAMFQRTMAENDGAFKGAHRPTTSRDLVDHVLNNNPTNTDEAYGFHTDNPGNAGWLKYNEKTTTAYYDHSVPADVNKLLSLPGYSGERSGEWFDRPWVKDQIDETYQSILDNGFKEDSPVTVAVDKDGKPWIYEGNKRLIAAQRAGLNTVPASVRYLGGGENKTSMRAADLLPDAGKPVRYEQTPAGEQGSLLSEGFDAKDAEAKEKYKASLLKNQLETEFNSPTKGKTKKAAPPQNFGLFEDNDKLGYGELQHKLDLQPIDTHEMSEWPEVAQGSLFAKVKAQVKNADVRFNVDGLFQKGDAAVLGQAAQRLYQESGAPGRLYTNNVATGMINAALRSIGVLGDKTTVDGAKLSKGTGQRLAMYLNKIASSYNGPEGDVIKKLASDIFMGSRSKDGLAFASIDSNNPGGVRYTMMHEKAHGAIVSALGNLSNYFNSTAYNKFLDAFSDGGPLSTVLNYYRRSGYSRHEAFHEVLADWISGISERPDFQKHFAGASWGGMLKPSNVEPLFDKVAISFVKSLTDHYGPDKVVDALKTARQSQKAKVAGITSPPRNMSLFE